MGEIFGSMYCWFEDFFGLPLANYLWGQAAPGQTSNLYIGVGLWMIGLSFVIAVIYYYAYNPSGKMSKWWGWLIFLAVNGVINFIIGWQRTLYDYNAELMVAPDPVTKQEVPLQIYPLDCASFGVSNMILAIGWFFLFSMLVKWGSRNCSHTPF